MKQNKVLRMVEKFKDPTQVYYKRLVEENILNVVESLNPQNRLRGVTLCGPNYEYVVKRLFKNIVSELHIFERDPYIFNLIYKYAQDCLYYNRESIRLHNDDIENTFIGNSRYIELDLLEKLSTTRDLISKQLDSQKKIMRGMKIFRFSSSIRREGIQKKFKIVQKIVRENLGATIQKVRDAENPFGIGESLKESTGRAKYAKLYYPNFKNMGRIFDMRVYTYSDTGPIFTCSIIYE